MLRPPTRAEVATRTVAVLGAGGPTKADLLVVHVENGPVVVKDFGGKAWWVRLLGRVQIRREHRAYLWLGAMPGLPRLVGRVDAHALALEKVEGDRLADVPDRFDPVAVLSQLRGLIDRIHRTGLCHLDLRGRENVLVRPDGRLAIVDFAGALWFRPGSVLHGLFFRRLAWTDEAAYLKWKARLMPGAFTAEEEQFLRRFRRLRALWVFNLKHPRSGRT